MIVKEVTLSQLHDWLAGRASMLENDCGEPVDDLSIVDEATIGPEHEQFENRKKFAAQLQQLITLMSDMDNTFHEIWGCQ